MLMSSHCGSFVAVIFAVSALVMSTRAAMHDEGCLAKAKIMKRSRINVMLEMVPRCSSGGLWQTVQCTAMDGCRCVYVDSGDVIEGLKSVYSRQSYRFLLKNCPIATNKRTQNRCVDPPVTYPCDVTQTKFVYNEATRRCDEVEATCFGFANRDVCERRCEARVFDRCSFPADSGNEECGRNQASVRFHYNVGTQRCQHFYYNGCDGNSNNYQQLWMCEKNCAKARNVTVMIDVDSSRDYNVTLPVWMARRERLTTTRVNTVTNSRFQVIRQWALVVKEVVGSDEHEEEAHSRLLSTSGNKPTIDNFMTLSPSKQRAHSGPDGVCQLPMKIGPCRAYMPRWYFEPKVGGCKKFGFGGCFPNANNFVSLARCTNYCSDDTDDKARDSTEARMLGNTHVLDDFGAGSSILIFRV